MTLDKLIAEGSIHPFKANLDSKTLAISFGLVKNILVFRYPEKNPRITVQISSNNQVTNIKKRSKGKSQSR
jgi:hypothetical protein